MTTTGKTSGITKGLSLLLGALLLSACGKECQAPALNVSKLESLKRSLFSSGPTGYLVVPNPIEATRNLQATASDQSVLNALEPFRLSSLASPSRLENDFIRVRIKGIDDDVSTLATPTSDGSFTYKVSDVHYSEVMAYHGVSTMLAYVESLGFSVVKSRPLYVMVRAAGGTAGSVNAIYDHNYLNPKLPRTMRLFGETPFAPGMDRDMYWHEFGHLFNESASHEVGMDYAGDTGAIFTEGSALHECLADYLAESVAGTGNIGRWLAKNMQGYNGQPLRYATDRKDNKSNFQKVILNDGTGDSPERYTVAEWCTRVLWNIRQKFVDQDPKAGPLQADRLVFSAVSLLKKDTSIKRFQESLAAADEQLHCGEHNGDIENAFNSRGFSTDPDSLTGSLQVTASPVGVDTNASSGASTSPSDLAGTTGLGFQLTIKNTSSVTARNVRARLETNDPNLHVITYQQGYGDLPANRSISVGGSAMGYEFSPLGELDRNLPTGRVVRYRIRVSADNGGETVVEGQVTK